MHVSSAGGVTKNFSTLKVKVKDLEMCFVAIVLYS